jgi:hypothetical protein
MNCYGNESEEDEDEEQENGKEQQGNSVRIEAYRE